MILHEKNKLWGEMKKEKFGFNVLKQTNRYLEVKHNGGHCIVETCACGWTTKLGDEWVSLSMSTR